MLASYCVRPTAPGPMLYRARDKSNQPCRSALLRQAVAAARDAKQGRASRSASCSASLALRAAPRVRHVRA